MKTKVGKSQGCGSSESTTIQERQERQAKVKKTKKAKKLKRARKDGISERTEKDSDSEKT